MGMVCADLGFQPPAEEPVWCPLCPEQDARVLTLQLNTDSKGLHESHSQALHAHIYM